MSLNNAGRIKTLTIGTTLRAAWTYDGFQKLRIKAATSPAATTHYIWDSFGHIIAEHNATGGAALKQYIWLGDTPLAVFDNTTLYYVHPDHLDRPVAMTNASAMTIAWQAKYDPFGNPVAVTVSPVNNQRLPGQWFQSEDGLSYNWHRTYDPTLGRYTQADPLRFVDGPSLYGYAGQSAVMKVDVDGRTVVGPMTPIPQPPNPDAPKQCEWSEGKRMCHQICSDLYGGKGGDTFGRYRKCMRACLGGTEDF